MKISFSEERNKGQDGMKAGCIYCLSYHVCQSPSIYLYFGRIMEEEILFCTFGERCLYGILRINRYLLSKNGKIVCR